MRYVWKLTPVSCYDLSGLESWLESLAAQGLFPKKIRPVRSVFARGTPRQVRYRIEYCKKAGRDGPPQDLVELYREFGWDYAGSLPNRTLLLFSTQNPQAEEPHTDPPLQGELLEQLLRKLKQELWVSAVCLLLLAVLLVWTFRTPFPLLYWVKSFTPFYGAASILFGIVALFQQGRGYRRLSRAVRQLKDGVPLPHPIAYPRRTWSQVIAALLCIGLLFTIYFHPILETWELNFAPEPQVEDYFTPLSLQELEGGSPMFCTHTYLDHSPLCWDQVRVVQSDQERRENARIRLELHWYRPLFPSLAQPMARDLLQSALPLDGDGWWSAPAREWDNWTVTEYPLDGVDWCAVALQPEGAFQAAALAGNGRAVLVQYTGHGDLTGHLDSLAAMVR